MPLDPQHFAFDFDTATGVATITLNRPDKFNALTFESYNELRDAFRTLHATEDVRSILVTGQGRAFCSGGDVQKIIGKLLERGYPALLEFTRMTGQLIAAIRRCNKPVVAGLNGLVAGAGAVVACACDIRVAAESAKIAFLFSRVGLSGADMGAAWLLPRIVGHARASELLMLGEFISATEAERIGLYNRVVSDDELMSAAREMAERLAAGPTFALGLTKELITREAAMDLETALEADSQSQAVCMQHPHFQEGFDAFVERRKPKFV
ncbi:MAG: enoyl-CoA hydratase family protein [Myxococcota bacterium]|nr:enoyl-CoA hydratase family protein [Myxococcota bacterium]